MKVKLLFLTLLLSFQGIFAMGGPGARAKEIEKKMTYPVYFELPVELQTYVLFLDLQSTKPADLQTVEQKRLFQKKLQDPFLTNKQRKSILFSLLKKFTSEDLQTPEDLLDFLQLLARADAFLSEREIVHGILLPLIKKGFMEEQTSNFITIAGLKSQSPDLFPDKIIRLFKKSLLLATRRHLSPVLSKFPGLKALGNSIKDLLDAQTPGANEGDFGITFISSLEGIEKLPENVTELFLSYNWLKDIPANSFDKIGPQLKKLYLDNNDIEKLPDNLFAKLSNLEYLNLSGNKIASLSLNLIKNLKKLRKLDLDFSTHIPTEVDEFLKKNNVTIKRF